MANVAATGMMQRLLGQGLITQEEATRAMQDPAKAMRDWQGKFGQRVNAVSEQMIESDPDVSVGQATNIPGIAGPIAIPGTPQAGQAPQAGARDIYEDLSDDQLGQLSGMGDLDRQMAQAEAMRDTAALEGRYVNQGRTYVADSPLAHAVRGAKIFKGQKGAKRIGGEQTEGRRTVIDLLRNRGRSNNAMEPTGGEQDILDFDPRQTRGLA